MYWNMTYEEIDKLIDAKKHYTQLLKDYDALLTYTRRLHAAAMQYPDMAEVCQDAPYDVLREEKS